MTKIQIAAIIGLICAMAAAFIVPPYLHQRERDRQARIEEQRPLCEEYVRRLNKFMLEGGRSYIDDGTDFDKCMQRQVDGEPLHTGVFAGH